MTDSITKPDTKIQPPPQQVSLSFTQLLASVLAAVSASIAASVFGVAGTLIGAALGSSISVLGGFIYARSLERSRQAVRLTLGVAAARRSPRGPGQSDNSDTGSDEGSPDETGAWAGRGRRLRVAFTPKRLALGAGALFVLTMGLITGFELLTGQPVAASVDGQHGSGVSVLGGHKKSGKSHAPTSPAPSSSAPTSTVPASSGTAVPTPTVTVTLSPSVTPSATRSTVAPSASSSPTAPSADGSVTGTPGGG